MLKRILVAAALLAVGALCLLLFTGRDVHEKFAAANRGVTSEVTFGPSEPAPVSPGKASSSGEKSDRSPKPSGVRKQQSKSSSTPSVRPKDEPPRTEEVIQSKRMVRKAKRSQKKPASEITIVREDLGARVSPDSIPKRAPRKRRVSPPIPVEGRFLPAVADNPNASEFEEVVKVADVADVAKLTDVAEVADEAFEGFENRVSAPQPRRTVGLMTETSSDPMSTFSVDVDTGAYTLARARLRQGYLPKKEDIRIEEFLNYFHYDYPAPAAGDFAVHLEAAPDPFAPGSKRRLIRVGVQGREVADAERPPAHLTFLIDVSGSMFGRDKLELAREALTLVTRNLRADDTIAIVTYARGAKVDLWPAGATERDLGLAAIAQLEAGGSSAMDEGLALAYRVASTHFYAGHINRVVMMSDGRANVGKTSPAAILATIRHGVEDGVTLSTIGFGAKSFNDEMMERLADRGNGNYFFVDSYKEAERVFGDRLCGTLHVIAKDVKIQVEFNPESVVRHQLLGYENRLLEHREFRDDAVDAGEIGAGHSVTAIYAVQLSDAPGRELATVRIRHKQPNGDVADEGAFQLWTEEVHPDVRGASADFKFAAAVTLFAQVLNGRLRGDAARLSLIREIAGEGVTREDEQLDRAEFLALVEAAAPYFE